MSPMIHHFGRIVISIESYLDSSPWKQHGSVVVDPLQNARLCMVKLEGSAGQPIVELIEPMGEKSRIYRAQQSGVGWHHICFSFCNNATADKFLKNYRMLPVTDWEPALLFGNQTVRFAYTRSRELIELVVDDNLL